MKESDGSRARDTEWTSLREWVLERDRHRCIDCGATKDLHVHHVVPRHLGGRDDPANLVALCSGCHASRHPSSQLFLARRFIERLAVHIAKWFDRTNQLPADTDRVLAALHLLRRDRLRDGQFEVILAALRGDSVLVVRPTGWGKSLCFQIPALLREGMTYVISPTKPLMRDQVSGLQKTIPTTFINSDLSGKEKQARLCLIDRELFKLVYLTPERFDREKIADDDEVERLAKHRLAYLVIDEAHLVAHWGDTFRPSYGRLGLVHQQLGSPPVLAFTATAGRETQQRIIKSLGIPNAKVFVSDVDRPNIGLIRCKVRSETDKIKASVGLIEWARRRRGKTMIFVPTIKIGARVQEALRDKTDLRLDFVHGQLEDNLERQALEDRWAGRITPELSEVICTSAMGMGIDVPNVRVVIHWIQPGSVEAYLQEVGRAGRDGRPTLAVVFKHQDSDDTEILRYRAEQSVKNNAGKDEVLEREVGAIKELDRILRNEALCFRRELLSHCAPKVRQTRTWAVRLLEWCLGARQHVRRPPFCCDRCHNLPVERFLNCCQATGWAAMARKTRGAEALQYRAFPEEGTA